MNIITIPTRIELIAMLPHGSTIAEIGVCKAYFSKEMLDLPNLKKLWLIDPWVQQQGYVDPLADSDHEENLREALRVLSGHARGGRFEILRKTSLHAVQEFNPGQLDAVYIDADHSYQAVLDDLRAWSEVVRPGGYIMGHDYTENEQAKKWNFGVVQAVNEFCSKAGWHITHLTDEDFASFCLRKN